MVMIRDPVVAGQFYPGSPEQLRSMIEGMVDEKSKKEDVIGVVLPHAGYIYSGSVVGAPVQNQFQGHLYYYGAKPHR